MNANRIEALILPKGSLGDVKKKQCPVSGAFASSGRSLCLLILQ